jgi:UDPglucose--hexose-1-phosphate uridylyltransferase
MNQGAKMPIAFKSERKTVEVLAADGTPMSYELEYRWDPLTSRLSVICPHLKKKWTEFYSVRDDEWLTEMVEASKDNCPFCRPLIDQIAAKFSPDQLDEETITVNGVMVFPNLYPRTDFEAVITSPDVHYLTLDEFDPDLLYKFLTAALDCIKKAYRKNDALLYPVIGGNYLPPAGASLVHYHMQLSMQEYPFESIRTLIDASAQYEKCENANYWSDLMNNNKEREIKRENNIYWYTPFAPVGFCEVRAIITKPNFLKFTTDDVRDIAEGLSAVLKYYYDHGFASFNFILYSGRLDSGYEGILSGLQIVARPNPRPNYLSIDSWYMPLLLRQTIVLERPEELARDVRKYF